MSTPAKKKIFVFGASGHAKVVIDIIEKEGLYDIAFLIDDAPDLQGRTVYDYRVSGGKEDLLQRREEVEGGVVAIGSNRARKEVAQWLEENGFMLVTCIHPAAEIARGVVIERGTVVMAGAVINSDAYVGRNVIVNTRVSIDHDCVVCDSVHIAPGSTLCGTVSVGSGSFICAGSTVIPNLTIGKNVIIGAGSTVIRNVPDFSLEVGVPAKYMRTLEEF